MNTIQAKHIMTKNVVTVDEDMPVVDLSEFLLEKMISGAPVLNSEGKLVGVVSLSDLARTKAEQATIIHEKTKSDFYIKDWDGPVDEEELEGFHLEINEGLQVGDIMTPLVFSVSEDTPLAEMAEIMSTGRIHRLIVTQEDDVVGIVTTMDILAVVARGGLPAEETVG